VTQMGTGMYLVENDDRAIQVNLEKPAMSIKLEYYEYRERGHRDGAPAPASGDITTVALSG
jgi:hypothetical protein